MFAVFNRFNPAYEEAARDLGATPWQAFRHVVLPLIGPSVVGIGMFGFTLSWDEIARTSQAIGDVNTLPLELQGLTSTVTTPAIYALGTVTTVVSLLVMAVAAARPRPGHRNHRPEPGILCFLGVLAFHFPQYLTTPELRRSYNVDVMRFMMLGAWSSRAGWRW
jgi:putative spermidine/putrescine transport system permease protein